MNLISGQVMQIGCIAFGVDLMFGIINRGTFPLTNMVVKAGTGIFSTIFYTGPSVVINEAGPVYGSLILLGAGLFTTEYLQITNFKQDLNDYYSSLFNAVEVEYAKNLAGVTENLSYDI